MACLFFTLIYDSYHFCSSNVLFLSFPQTSDHVLWSRLYCTLCLESLFFHFPGKFLLILYSLDVASTPSGSPSYKSIPQAGWLYAFTHSFNKLLLSTYIIAHQFCCTRSRDTAAKRNTVSCPQSSYVLIKETGNEQKQTSQQVKETVRDHCYKENKTVVLRGHLGLKVKEGTVMQACSWGKEKHTKAFSCSRSAQYFFVVLSLFVV